MKKIKIKFVDFWSGFDEYNNDFYKILNEKYDVEISEEPEFLFYSVFGYKNLDYDCIKIFYTGENIIPDFNNCDYAIGFHKIEFGKRYLRMPLYNLFIYKKYFENALKIHKEKIDKRNKFCNFIYSNENGDKKRKEFYELLSKYKKVDSGGKYLNNIGGPVEDKYEFQRQYKFSIAFENSSSVGYNTEKLIEAKAAGTIPIYWGDPEIAKEFNSKSFINCHDYEDFEKVVEKVIEIDNDDELYRKYLKESFNQKEEKLVYENEEKLRNFIYFIVDNKEKMRCDCTAVRGYASGLKKYSILKKSKYVKPYIKLLKKLGLIKGV